MDGQILMEDDMTPQELVVSASIARQRRTAPGIRSRCTAHMLIPGDVVAIYAGGLDRYDHAATVERAVDAYEFTPDGHVTLWTTSGRYDVPADARLDVVAWAPLAR
jgi:hypothetical protein